VCDLEKPQEWGGHDPRWVAAPQKKKTPAMEAQIGEYKYSYTSFSNFKFQITANKMQRLFIFTYALHASSDSSTHHQEQITVHTASGIVNQYCC